MSKLSVAILSSVAILLIVFTASASQQNPQQEKAIRELAKQYGVTKEQMEKVIRAQIVPARSLIYTLNM